MTRTTMLKIVSLTLATFSLCSETDAIKGQRFMNRTDLKTALSLPLETWSSPSVVSCAVGCCNKYPRACMSFRYNSSTAKCTWGRSVEVETLVDPYSESDYGSLDDMYSSCPGNSSFSYYTHNFSTYCLYFSSINETGTQQDAAMICKAMGGKLVTIKTLTKWTALDYFLYSVLDFWVGLDDKAVEGTFRWIDTGQEVDEAVKTTMFTAPALTSTSSAKDCVYYSLGNVYEGYCVEEHHIVCEIE